MELQQQKELLSQIGIKTLQDNPNEGWFVYASFHGGSEAGVPDPLGDDIEATMLTTKEEIEEYLTSRSSYYHNDLGLFVDIACQYVDESKGVDWWRVGFEHESGSLVFKAEDSSNEYLIPDFTMDKFDEAISILETCCFPRIEEYRGWGC